MKPEKPKDSLRNKKQYPFILLIKKLTIAVRRKKNQQHLYVNPTKPQRKCHSRMRIKSFKQLLIPKMKLKNTCTRRKVSHKAKSRPQRHQLSLRSQPPLKSMMMKTRKTMTTLKKMKTVIMLMKKSSRMKSMMLKKNKK